MPCLCLSALSGLQSPAGSGVIERQEPWGRSMDLTPSTPWTRITKPQCSRPAQPRDPSLRLSSAAHSSDFVHLFRSHFFFPFKLFSLCTALPSTPKLLSVFICLCFSFHLDLTTFFHQGSPGYRRPQPPQRDSSIEKRRSAQAHSPSSRRSRVGGARQPDGQGGASFLGQRAHG